MGARALENRYVQAADAVVYVSKRNLERVRDRQPPGHADTFHLIRRGVQSLPAPNRPPDQRDDFRIRYIGGPGGWFDFLPDGRSPALLKRLYKAWEALGTYSSTDLDFRTHGPIYVGRAVKRLLAAHPEWRGRIHIDVYGKRYPKPVTDAVLEQFGLQDVVHLRGRIPHEDALRKIGESDLLFMALPDRTDGSPGGRISAKTYEYLRSNRPILAALPPGENREYLRDKPGVHLTDPDGIATMASVISELAAAKFEGASLSVDRAELGPALSAEARARAFERVLSATLPSQ
jgi:glycosyltransferase involved in cell wall biosynthesis